MNAYEKFLQTNPMKKLVI